MNVIEATLGTVAHADAISVLELIASLVVAGCAVGVILARMFRNSVDRIVIDVIDKRLAGIEAILRDTNSRLVRLETLAADPRAPGLKVLPITGEISEGPAR